MQYRKIEAERVICLAISEFQITQVPIDEVILASRKLIKKYILQYGAQKLIRYPSTGIYVLLFDTRGR